MRSAKLQVRAAWPGDEKGDKVDPPAAAATAVPSQMPRARVRDCDEGPLANDVNDVYNSLPVDHAKQRLVALRRLVPDLAFDQRQTIKKLSKGSMDNDSAYGQHFGGTNTHVTRVTHKCMAQMGRAFRRSEEQSTWPESETAGQKLPVIVRRPVCL